MKTLSFRSETLNTTKTARPVAARRMVASADAVRTAVDSAAKAALFTNQIAAFEAAPSVYAQRLYLQSLVRSTAGARKYVLLTTNSHDVLQFDLQEKIRTDILNDVLVAPKNK